MQTVVQESKVLKEKVLNLSPEEFDVVALEVFKFQAKFCEPYKTYINNLKVHPDKITNIEDIPYLPISAFKQEKVISGSWIEQALFSSSTTTGSKPSTHYVKDLQWYNEVSKRCFQENYGELSDFSFFGLLPSYLERSGSSLIHMVDCFIKASNNPGGFYLYDHHQLIEDLKSTAGNKILIGVSYALLDFVKIYEKSISGLLIMETGGMKGRRKEISRPELHKIFKSGFNVADIHSEYGMTEMMSQAYSSGNGIFSPSFSMKVSTVQLSDPLTPECFGKTGVLRIIDLGNIDTCSFIMTDDLGVVDHKGKFEVLGRADHSEIRGCNLMVSDL